MRQRFIIIFLFMAVCLSLTNLHSAKVLNQQQELIDQQVEELKKAVKKRATEIMAVNPCDATLEDWLQAGECAADAFQLGQEALADSLMEWIKITFRALVAQDVDAIMESTLWEKLQRGEGEELLVHGKIQDEIQRSEDIMRTRGDLAAQAQLLGYNQLADDILAGEYIQSPCIQLWNIVVTVDLKSTQDSWLLDSYESKVVFKEVPIYFWDPELELSPMFSSAWGKGTLEEAKFGWYDGEDWIKGTAQGQPVWEIEIFQWIEDRSSYKDSPFILSFNYAPFYILNSRIPSRTVAGFNPPVISIPSDLNSHLSGPKYEDTDPIDQSRPLVLISGKVTTSLVIEGTSSLNGISGVVMSGLPGDPITDDEGKYSAEVEVGWTGDVIPNKSQYFFSPSYIEYFEVSEDQADQDYLAVTMTPVSSTRPRISGNYTPNVRIKYSDGEEQLFERMGDFTFSLSNDTEIRIPHEKLQKGNPFTIEATHEDANYIGIVKFEFTPVRILKWKEKQK